MGGGTFQSVYQDITILGLRAAIVSALRIQKPILLQLSQNQSQLDFTNINSQQIKFYESSNNSFK